jgi:hypothetical protein
MILAKKQCLAAPGHMTGLTAYENTIAQKFSRIKTAESMLYWQHTQARFRGYLLPKA